MMLSSHENSFIHLFFTIIIVQFIEKYSLNNISFFHFNLSISKVICKPCKKIDFNLQLFPSEKKN